MTIEERVAALEAEMEQVRSLMAALARERESVGGLLSDPIWETLEPPPLGS